MLYKSVSLLFLALSFKLLASENVIFEYQNRLNDILINTENQSFCFTKDNQNNYFGEKLTQNPASVTKLFASYWALKTKKAHFRFKTELLKKNNDLYLKSDGDPYFMTQQLFLLIRHLADNGITKIDTIYVDQKLNLDWKNNKNYLRAQLIRVFNPNTWDKNIYELIKEYGLTDLVNKKTMAMSALKVVFVNKLSGFELLTTLKSPPLYRQLKEVNKYSNNFYFDTLVTLLGGEKAFNQFVSQNLNIPLSSFHFYNGSGLGVNYIKCDHALKILKSLHKEANSQMINLNDLLPISGVDKGTLENRMQGWPGSSWAKTGTLRSTSALAGIINRGGEYEYFVFLNSTTSLAQVREIQDDVLEDLYRDYGNVTLIDYQENTINIIKESLVE